ncbi:MAG: hypothetical protein MJ223_02355 [Mycoplasmoidaceae bacterium]|nr:hypothetical protein [Mycoplasmoidaceae bacterium]
MYKKTKSLGGATLVAASPKPKNDANILFFSSFSPKSQIYYVNKYIFLLKR